MTREYKVVFNLEDISKIRVLCSNCSGEMTVPMKAETAKEAKKTDRGMPESECPYCTARWDKFGRPVEFSLISDIRSSLSTGERPVKLRFEMDMDREKA